MPGVRSASISSDLPFSGNASASSLLPDVAASQDATLRSYRHLVTPDFFATLGIPIRAGRAFTWQDRRSTPRVAIVNDAAAVRIWGQANAVGRRFRLGGGQGESVEVPHECNRRRRGQSSIFLTGLGSISPSWRPNDSR